MRARGGGARLACADCGRGFVTNGPTLECPCGGLLELCLGALPGATALKRAFAARRLRDATGRGSGVWRYRELVMPGRARPVTRFEGNTSVYRSPAVSRYVGLADLSLKHEGENPTGSFKDRGMTVAVTQALRCGASAVACASTGNTSASMAAYAAQAGLRALVFVPRGQVAAGKLAQALAYGARTLLVRGDFDACLRLARAAARELGVSLLNSINPWRLEGQKTILLELLEQRGWQAPDWIVVPAGNLGNTAAFGKALREARALGLIRSMPRIAAVQARGANPFERSFRADFRRRFRVRARTLATAIKIGDPASHERGVRAIRQTRGVVTSVSDSAILAAKAVVDAAGIGCEPASAAAVAGARQLVRRGVIRPGQSVACVLTGHLLKDPQAVIDFHLHGRGGGVRGANPPLEIGPHLRDVERALLP